MLRLKLWFTFVSLILIAQLNALSATPVQTDDDPVDNAIRGGPSPVHTEEPSTTDGVLSAMWHRITNYFAPTTAAPPLVEELQRQKRGVIVVPPETRRGNLHHDVRRMLKENGDQGVGRSSRGIQYAKVLHQPQFDGDSNSNQVRRKRTVAFVEEFDEGSERFKDTPNNAWATEKFSEGSDPVENIDKENYMEEIVREMTLQPILGDNHVPKALLNPIQIIEQ